MSTERRDAVLAAICFYGLKLHPRQLSPGERDHMLKWVKKILNLQRGVATSEIVNAIRHGMPRVWPFSEDGRSFDAQDVYNNITRAKGATATLERGGRVPITGREVRARFDRMRAEHGE